MIAMRSGDVPLRTKDGGATWHPLTSLKANAAVPISWFGAAYSWSGKTLAIAGKSGAPSAAHPHASYLWISKDDGDTWTDESGDNVAVMGMNIGQWFEDTPGQATLYMQSSGQGIVSKTFDEA